MNVTSIVRTTYVTVTRFVTTNTLAPVTYIQILPMLQYPEIHVMLSSNTTLLHSQVRIVLYTWLKNLQNLIFVQYQFALFSLFVYP